MNKRHLDISIFSVCQLLIVPDWFPTHNDWTGNPAW
jgi:hypothetical protein